MIHVTTEAGGIRLTRGAESFLISDAETPIFLANLIAHLTGRQDYAEGYRNGLDEGYRRAQRTPGRRAPVQLLASGD